MMHDLSQRQSGVSLIESLVAIVVFSIGVLAIAGLYATSIKHASDAKARGDAAYLANQIISQMWVDRGNLASYALYSSVANVDATCTGLGNTATFPTVTSWLGDESKKGTVRGMLPDAKAQILVETGTGAVTVTLCWKAPQETETHRYTSTALISG
jgi:type IV pilus assembly protein PilV